MSDISEIINQFEKSLEGGVNDNSESLETIKKILNTDYSELYNQIKEDPYFKYFVEQVKASSTNEPFCDDTCFSNRPSSETVFRKLYNEGIYKKIQDRFGFGNPMMLLKIAFEDAQFIPEKEQKDNVLRQLVVYQLNKDYNKK